ncbi:MAG: hypothetical protein QM278_05180 [Pseudomonadota bacterium]|nr:hypothetical protein [Pseudomonadota bacterium]
MKEYRCPHCGHPVKILKYGYGWVGLCCDRIVYNSSKPYGKDDSQPAGTCGPAADEAPAPFPSANNAA